MTVLIRFAGKSVSWLVEQVCHWYVAVAVLIVASVYFIASPFFLSAQPKQLRSLVEMIPDPAIREAMARIDGEKRIAAMRATLLAYDKVYGAGVWGRQFASETKGERRPRFADIAEVAIGISSAPDRERFVAEHMDVYGMCLKSGWIDLAHVYADALAELQSIGGESWHEAMRHPVSVFVYTAIKDDRELWNWYLENASWCVDYLQALAPDGETGGLSAYLKVMRANQEALRLAREEIVARSDEELLEAGAEDGTEFSRDGYFAAAFSFIAEWGDVLRPLARVRAPMLVSFTVLAQNLDAFRLDSPADRTAAGTRLAALWSEHDTSPVWHQASLPSGVGVVRLYDRAPLDAGKVIGMYGDCYVASFLLDERYYGKDDRLLSAATHAIAEWGEPGWAILVRFKESEEFKRLLTREDIGCRVVPYVLNFGPETAIAKLLDDPAWADRYFNPDGSLKHDKRYLIEAFPFVGGISTVAKNWIRGYPCTMEEIGWAAFDVADIAVTVASFGAAAAATTTAKEGGRLAVKQGAKQAGGALLKKGGRYVLEASARKASSKLTLRILRGVGRGLLTGGKWTVKALSGTVKVVAMPIGKAMAAWKSLPPVVRKGLIRTAACVMFGVVIWNRTLKLLPGILHDLTVELTVAVERIVKSIASGVVDGLTAAVADALGDPDLGDSVDLSRTVSWSCAACCVLLVFVILARRRRRAYSVVR